MFKFSNRRVKDEQAERRTSAGQIHSGIRAGGSVRTDPSAVVTAIAVELPEIDYCRLGLVPKLGTAIKRVMGLAVTRKTLTIEALKVRETHSRGDIAKQFITNFEGFSSLWRASLE